MEFIVIFAFPGKYTFDKPWTGGIEKVYWPRWFVLNRRRFVLVSGAIILLLMLLWGIGSLFSNSRVAPEELFDYALQNTLASTSYRYSVEVKQEGQEVISSIQGERVEPDRVRIKGSMLKSKSIEFIQLDNTTYMKDPWSDCWITLEENKLAQSELFITEFNPLALFNFKDVPEIKNGGRDRVDGVKTVVLELKPVVQNPYLELKYVDYDYKVWIDPDQKLIRKAGMEAKLPGGKTGMVVNMKFWDYNQPIFIEKPQLTAGSN